SIVTSLTTRKTLTILRRNTSNHVLTGPAPWSCSSHTTPQKATGSTGRSSMRLSRESTSLACSRKVQRTPTCPMPSELTATLLLWGGRASVSSTLSTAKSAASTTQRREGHDLPKTTPSKGTTADEALFLCCCA